MDDSQESAKEPLQPVADIGDADLVGDGGLKDQVIEALCTVFDPEIPVNIHAMGMIYGIKLDPEGKCRITMTLTSPACPVAGSLPGEVETRVRSIPGITGVEVNLVWDPPWEMSMISEDARLSLGL